MSKVTAICNQKGGVTKTTSAVNLGVGLARQGKKVLLVDTDPQADATTCLGWPEQDKLPITLAGLLEKPMDDEPIASREGILSHHAGKGRCQGDAGTGQAGGGTGCLGRKVDGGNANGHERELLLVHAHRTCNLAALLLIWYAILHIFDGLRRQGRVYRFYHMRWHDCNRL